MKRFHNTFRLSAVVMLTVLAVFGLNACSNSNSGSDKESLSGTVATGTALADAVVLIKGANGQMVSVNADANGDYSANVSDLTFPVIINAYPPGEGADLSKNLYSWAFGEGTANVTPFTHMALVVNATLPDSLDALFTNWETNAASMTSDGMLAAQATVNKNLESYFTDASVPFQTYDFLETPFDADGSGIDAVLDAIDFIPATDTFVISQNGDGPEITFDIDIDISGIEVGGTPGGDGGGDGGTIAGIWKLTVTGTVNGIAIPENVTTNIPAEQIPATQTAFQETGGNFAGTIATSFSYPGAELTVVISNLQVTYNATIAGAVGDVINGTVQETVTITGTITVDGIETPINIDELVDLAFKYERIS